MAHQRQRLLQAQILKSIKHSPIVGIVGQRQTGKTTLTESLVSGERYVSLDQAVQLAAARTNPEAFLDRGTTLFGIDECQLAPELFPALKEAVRVLKKPGRFLLTGSVRFTSRKIIRESLTGRIVTHELLPLCIAELNDYKLGDVVNFLRLSLSEMQKICKNKIQLISEKSVADYLLKGGLPGICFFRDPHVRAERFNAHLDTLLRRDIQLVLETTLPFEKLFKTMQYFAFNQGKPLSISELSRFTRISAPSLRKLVPALEALFLIRRIETIGDRKKEIFFLEDQGMASFLTPRIDAEVDLLRFVFSQCLAQIKYLHPHSSIRSYETRGGARVPLVLDVSGKMTGLIPTTLETPDTTAIASAESFLRRNPKAVVAILTRGKVVVPLSSKIIIVPYRAIV
ncbi:MAG: AAA family ATPase [Oligoflexia bacterium]|nr:AAA family ATPase [Oligoflexia bacterium]